MAFRFLVACVIAVAVALAGTAPAYATDTRRFRGEGDSSMGLAYWYAYMDALHQADVAGYSDCVQVDSYTSPGRTWAWVVVECTR
jgi:hypothetical protein